MPYFSLTLTQQTVGNSFGADDYGTNTYNWPSENTLSAVNQLPSEVTWENLQQGTIQPQGMARAATDPGGGPGGRPPLPLGEGMVPLVVMACLYVAYRIFKRFRNGLYSG